MRIDPHVHDYGGIAWVMKLARKQGINTLLVMPSRDKPVLREKDLKRKIVEARRKKLAGQCFFYIKLTSDQDQIEEAVRLVEAYREAVGLKLFPPENEKKEIYQLLSQLAYKGVLAVHAEKASLLKTESFNPLFPWTHGLAHPAEAEIESIKEQIAFAKETSFQGPLYICHISLWESAEIIWQAKNQLTVYSEVTPHHLLCNDLLLKVSGEYGIFFKVDPPLRKRKAVAGLVRAVQEGLIDCLGTDFAYHGPLEKLFYPYSSGIAHYDLYREALAFLREKGINEERLEEMTCGNIKKIFAGKLA